MYTFLNNFKIYEDTFFILFLFGLVLPNNILLKYSYRFYIFTLNIINILLLKKLSKNDPIITLYKNYIPFSIIPKNDNNYNSLSIFLVISDNYFKCTSKKIE